MERQTVRPVSVLLALVAAAVALALVAFGLSHSKARHFAEGGPGPSRSGSRAAAGPEDDEKDDPSQVDTIYLGDAADAPTPARRSGHTSSVHPTILIRLPRYGPQTGLIPDVPAGHLLYQWLAAFNQASLPALEQVLPNSANASAAAAQLELRQRTGGFNLLSAKEAQPGVLVFRLRDQTPDGNEALGTLQMRPGQTPAAIGSFSLRRVP